MSSPLISHQIRYFFFYSLPGRKHTVVLSVQLVSDDLVVRAHPSLKSRSHEILRDFPFEGPQVML